MAQMLISKLGGLLNRRIYYLPLARNSRLSVADADAIRTMCEECKSNRGILLLQPEHILSFKLMGLGASIAGKTHLATSLLSTQAFFDSTARDIMDESDENLGVRNELIHTMGTSRLIEGAPQRWHIHQVILGLVPSFASQVKQAFPQSVDIQKSGNSSFPRIRLMKDDATRRLLELIAHHVSEHGLPGIPIQGQAPYLRQSIVRYITKPDLSTAEIDEVQKSMIWSPDTRRSLLVARGLIACKLVAFVFESKRYRVNYGLDPSRASRTKTAVPFRSKDTPSPRSEYSHPDIVILLTLLSYYIRGLTDEEMTDAFIHLLNSDQADIQYRDWVSTADSSLPVIFHQLAGISLKDRTTCINEISPSLRYSKGAVDYYVSNLVFSKELRVYPQKTSASSWDLAAAKTHPMTGLSGTNDAARLLPISMEHLNLPKQRHTDAEVLGLLLKEETNIEELPPRATPTLSDAEHMLHTVRNLENSTIPVILDVGAQVLDRNNREVAQLWLESSSLENVKAVVYFEDEQLSVIDRTGYIEALNASPYGKMLHCCLVYIDDEHTRGTDLKLPDDYRAAVTLGANLTKDRLVQAWYVNLAYFFGTYY